MSRLVRFDYEHEHHRKRLSTSSKEAIISQLHTVIRGKAAGRTGWLDSVVVLLISL
jgi:hypothetical protein